MERLGAQHHYHKAQGQSTASKFMSSHQCSTLEMSNPGVLTSDDPLVLMLVVSQCTSVAGGPLGPPSCVISADHWREVLGRREKQEVSLLPDGGC